jgi:hypothetical protein
MLNFVATEMGKTALLILLPIAGALLLELIKALGNAAIEYADPAIRQLKKNYGVIDLAMRVSSPELRNAIEANPVAAFGKEILSEVDPALSDAQVKRALVWASAKFNYNLHDRAFGTLSPEQEALRDKVVQRVQEKF